MRTLHGFHCRVTPSLADINAKYFFARLNYKLGVYLNRNQQLIGLFRGLGVEQGISEFLVL